VVDFYCAACRLVVELDGDTHVEQVEYDAARTQWLERQGCRVIRFTNHEVHTHLQAVLEVIWKECHADEDVAVSDGRAPSP